MLNIELVRFEAQDVITASVAAPAAPAEPDCICKNGTHIIHNGNHYINVQGQNILCEATTHED